VNGDGWPSANVLQDPKVCLLKRTSLRRAAQKTRGGPEKPGLLSNDLEIRHSGHSEHYVAVGGVDVADRLVR
jgi:hypothetical protein